MSSIQWPDSDTLENLSEYDMVDAIHKSAAQLLVLCGMALNREHKQNGREFTSGNEALGLAMRTVAMVGDEVDEFIKEEHD